MNKTFERVTIMISIIGAYMVSTNSELSKYGYILFLISSVLFIFIGVKYKLESVWVTNIIFALMNVNGIYNFWLK